jgi:hypothetical protein
LKNFRQKIKSLILSSAGPGNPVKSWGRFLENSYFWDMNNIPLVIFSIRYGGHGEGLSTPHDASSGLPEIVSLPLVTIFLLFLAYIVFRVWKSLKKDEKKETGRK